MNNKFFYIFIFFIFSILNNSRAAEYYAVIKLPLYDLVGKEQYIDLAKAEITDKIINKIFNNTNICNDTTCDNSLEQEIQETHCIRIICEYLEDTTDMKIVYDKQYAQDILIASNNNLKNSTFSNITGSQSLKRIVGVPLKAACTITLRRLEEFISDIIFTPDYKNKASIFSLEVAPYKQGVNDNEKLLQLKFSSFFLMHGNAIRQCISKQTDKPCIPELQN